MRRKKAKNFFIIGTIIVLAAGTIAVIYDIVSRIESAQETQAKKDLDNQIAEMGIKRTLFKNISDWPVYLNEEYGFEMKLPDYFTVKKNLSAAGSPVLSCGEQISDTFLTAAGESPDSRVYNITVYSNPKSVSPKDFFLCKIKALEGDDFSENEIAMIENFQIGPQKSEAARFYWKNTNETVMISHSGNIYEIQLKKDSNGANDPAELDLILSSFKFLK